MARRKAPSAAKAVLSAANAPDGAAPARYGPAAGPHDAGERDATRPGEHHEPDGAAADTVAQPAGAIGVAADGRGAAAARRIGRVSRPW